MFSTVEPCRSFDVRGNRAKGRLEVVRRARKCLHYYCYFVHPELGFVHVRLRSWFPFEVQVWCNGREWLARQLDRKGMGYTRHATASCAWGTSRRPRPCACASPAGAGPACSTSWPGPSTRTW